MKRSEILITGANGEIGQRLIETLAEEGVYEIIALDLTEPDADLAAKCKQFYRGNILDDTVLGQLETQHRFRTIFHLAGLLSSTGEKNPKLAHEVNVDGSIKVLQIAQNHSNLTGHPVVFMFSSSIAAYGLRPGDDRTVPIHSRQFLTPMTMYGINKLYIEQLGRYYSLYYRREDKTDQVKLDFRCLRFPGIISADTVPFGGTSDYGPEMIHAAAQGLPYHCFVDADTTLPFMVMPDAVKSLIQLSRADSQKLNHRIYNVTSFSLSAGQILEKTRQYFPEAVIDFRPDLRRQAIVASWPNNVDDGPAKEDWGWQPEFNFDSAFDDYLIPRISARYGVSIPLKSLP